ncbi:FMN-binding protein [Dehalobacter sp. UNSWDHB]|uniref:FMN-binding protein n=1 Tax=Dehalobacter sp. UNSWDHB TaxID=1339256 RepID=UPI001FA758CC|nr:4Fe-4S binding protein [Dehalobacter sp. UNSWDHB]
MILSKAHLKKLFLFMFFGSLIIALLFSFKGRQMDVQQFLPSMLSNTQEFKAIETHPLTYAGYKNTNGQDTLQGYVVFGQGNGYGGPVSVLTATDPNGNILKVRVVGYATETPSYIHSVLSGDFLKQFTGKSVDEPLEIGQDIDKVTSATLSSRGIANAVRQASHGLGKNQLALNISEPSENINLGIKEIGLALLILATIIGVRLKIAKLRWLVLICSIFFTGFWFNCSISLANIASGLMGFFPAFKQNLFWYILIVGIPLIIFLSGKNLYCYWLCPFGGVQEILAKIGGGKLKCNHHVAIWLQKIKYMLVWIVLILSFCFKSPSIGGSYEPFGVLFGFQGVSVQWILLSIILVVSLFIRRFWCLYFCPVGVINEIIMKARRFVNSLFQKKQEQGILTNKGRSL